MRVCIISPTVLANQTRRREEDCLTASEGECEGELFGVTVLGVLELLVLLLPFSAASAIIRLFPTFVNFSILF